MIAKLLLLLLLLINIIISATVSDNVRASVITIIIIIAIAIFCVLIMIAIVIMVLSFAAIVKMQIVFTLENPPVSQNFSLELLHVPRNHIHAVTEVHEGNPSFIKAPVELPFSFPRPFKQPTVTREDKMPAT